METSKNFIACSYHPVWNLGWQNKWLKTQRQERKTATVQIRNSEIRLAMSNVSGVLKASNICGLTSQTGTFRETNFQTNVRT